MSLTRGPRRHLGWTVRGIRSYELLAENGRYRRAGRGSREQRTRNRAGQRTRNPKQAELNRNGVPRRGEVPVEEMGPARSGAFNLEANSLRLEVAEVL